MARFMRTYGRSQYRNNLYYISIYFPSTAVYVALKMMLGMGM